MEINSAFAQQRLQALGRLLDLLSQPALAAPGGLGLLQLGDVGDLQKTPHLTAYRAGDALRQAVALNAVGAGNDAFEHLLLAGERP